MADNLGLPFDEVADILSDLECLNFFPTTDGGRMAVIKIVGNMCADLDQVRWLVVRMVTLYNNWPGPAELRAVFCKRYKPADGIDLRNHTSTYFPDGNIPGETPESPAFPSAPFLRGRKDLLLPPGHAVSADVEVENEIRRALPAVSMSAEKRREPAAVVPVNNFKRITAADLERAASAVRAAQSAPHEFEDSGVGDLCRVCWRAHPGSIDIQFEETA